MAEAKGAILTNALLAGLGVVLLFVLIRSWLLQGTLRPLNSLACATCRIAHGALDTDVPGLGRHDQAGETASLCRRSKMQPSIS